MDANTKAIEEAQKAARRLLRQTQVVLRVPWQVRRTLEEKALRKKGDRPAIDEIWRSEKLREQYRVSLRQWREYARLLGAVRFRSLCGCVIQGLASLWDMPIERADELHDSGNVMLLGRLAYALQKEDLDPACLAKLADALSRQNTSIAHIKARRLEHRKFMYTLRQAARERRKKPISDAELFEQVKKIYGVDMCRKEWPPGGKEQTEREQDSEKARGGETATAEDDKVTT